jgi:hypothetical protein
VKGNRPADTNRRALYNLVAMLWSEWKDLETQIVEMNDEVERIASCDSACTRLHARSLVSAADAVNTISGIDELVEWLWANLTVAGESYAPPFERRQSHP